MTQEKLKILILGSTGSIGTSTCNCVRRFRDRFEVTGLAAGTNLDTLAQQVNEFSPGRVFIADPRKAETLEANCSRGTKVLKGEKGLEQIVEET
ncbi:MAG: 1-deoxy-D-xylulose-5-phosphate reductoisomerase, partial [Chitinispirillaceae bacterium]